LIDIANSLADGDLTDPYMTCTSICLLAYNYSPWNTIVTFNI